MQEIAHDIRLSDNLLINILQYNGNNLTLAAHWLANLRPVSADANTVDGLVGDVLCALCYGATVTGIENVIKLSLEALVGEVASSPHMVELTVSLSCLCNSNPNSYR